MKALFVTTAAVALLASVPAFAQSGPVGSVGITYSDSSLEVAGLEADSDAWTLDGVVAVDAFAGGCAVPAAVPSPAGFASLAAVSCPAPALPEPACLVPSLEGCVAAGCCLDVPFAVPGCADAGAAGAGAAAAAFSGFGTVISLLGCPGASTKART